VQFNDDGRKVEVLDGDEVRKWLSPTEGFSRDERERHLRRVAHICQLLARNGIVVIAAFVSPYASTRQYARRIIDNYVEVYLKCSLETCIKRDPKGLYKAAIAGRTSLVTGIQDPYEVPENPDIIVDTENETVEESVQNVMRGLKERGWI